jgi:hypothetical protein
METQPDWRAELPKRWVLPRYHGRSVANLPATVGTLLGVTEGWASPALEPALLAKLPKRVKRVVLLLVDGLPWWRFEQQLAADDAGFHELYHRYGLTCEPLTSVAPSTTSVATTVIFGNGACAAETGMLGYQFLLPSLGVVANMLFWHPAGRAKARVGELTGWGLKPEDFVPSASLAQQLAAGGVPTRVIIPAPYTESPLSRMQLRGAQLEGYLSSVDMWLKLRGWLGETGAGFAYLYYPDFDSLSHRDSPDAAFWPELWVAFVWQLRRFVAQLSPKERRETLLMITADHGHLSTPVAQRRYFQDHPELLQMCALIPGGEPRHLYLYARHGAKGELLEYARAQLADRFVALDAEAALSGGLYGDTARMHPETPRRLGDVVLLAKGGACFWDKQNERVLLGKHGGLEPEEMLAPLVVLDLGR